jgi:hypothetical protein
VGESVLQIAPNAAAAYSLRSLTGGDPKVVRVRRSSDNTERDFNVSGINSGALENFCDEATPARNRTGGAKYSTFSTDGVTGFSAVCSAAAACGYDIFGASSTAVQVSFDVVLNSGSFSVQLRPEFETGSAVSNSVIIDSSGSKSFTLTSTAEFKALLFISGATNFVVSNFSVNVPYNHSAFVETWYDQSGNGRDAVQATAGSQPKIVNAGTLLNELDFDGTDDSLAIDFGADLSQANSLFMVHQSDTTSSNSNDFFDRISGSPRTLLDQSGSNYRMLSPSSAGTGVAVTTDKSLVFALYNGASSLFAKNGTATSVLDAGTQGINQNSLLGSSGSNFYNGTINEFIIYNSDQSANRASVETNINSHYSIF